MAIEVAAGMDYKERCCVAVAAVVFQDFVEGAHEATGLWVGPNEDQD